MKKYKQILFGTDYPSKLQVEKALERAWITRSFEIELYWKRALYFWGFIAAIFTAYLVALKENSELVTLLLAIAGITFSFAFYLANRGSKFWQENWEAHIDLLEGELVGNLYKVVMKQNKKAHLLSAKPYSVSNINSFLSLFLTGFWFVLVMKETHLYNDLLLGIICSLLKIDYAEIFLMVVSPLLLFCLLYYMQHRLKSSLDNKTTKYKSDVRGVEYVSPNQKD